MSTDHSIPTSQATALLEPARKVAPVPTPMSWTKPKPERSALDSSPARLARAESAAQAGATTVTSTARPSRDLIVTRAGVESPAPGRWSIPPQRLQGGGGSRWSRRTGTWTVQGALVVGDATTLELAATAPVPARRSRRGRGMADFHYRGVLVSSDRLGRWRFEGEAIAAGTVEQMSVDVAYHGVFRSGPHGVTWLVIGGAAVRGVTRWHRGVRRRWVRGLTGGFNALRERPADPVEPLR